MYYLSKDTESHKFNLSDKHFSKELIAEIKKAVKPVDIESGETFIPTIKVSPRLYNEACDCMGLGTEHQHKHLVIWDKDLLTAILNDNSTDQAGDSSSAGERIPMSGALLDKA